MVESVSGINSISSINAAMSTSSTKDAEKVKKDDEKTNKTEENKKTDEVTVQQSANAYDRTTIQNKVTEYIENLKKQYDYPDTVAQLTEYLDLFDVDKFMKTYPNITTQADFNTIMYNETIQYL